MDWKQNVNEVTVRLRCGDGIQRKEDVNTSFTDKSCHVSFPGELEKPKQLKDRNEDSGLWPGYLRFVTVIFFFPLWPWHRWSCLCCSKTQWNWVSVHASVDVSDGRQWSCQLQEEIEASCSRVQYKEKGGLLHVIMQKKIPFHVWPSLKVSRLTISTKMEAHINLYPSRNSLPSSSSGLMNSTLVVKGVVWLKMWRSS